MDRQAWPRKRSTWLYPGCVAVAATLGLAGVVAYTVTRAVRRGRRPRVVGG